MYDCVIIGAGPGGYVAALRAKQLGLKVAIIEKEHLGGVCLNWGCIPTKALLKSASLLEKLDSFATMGINISSYTSSIETMVKRSRDISEKLSKGIAHLLNKANIEVIKGHARLSRGQKPFVLDVDGQTLETQHVVIATGAKARTLSFEGVEGLWTAKEAMLPKKVPQSLLVIGGGVIGMEFASFYNSLGTTVTVIEQQDRILATEDDEIATIAYKSFMKKGIAFALGTSVNDICTTKEGYKATLSSGQTLEAEAVLVSIGIIGNTDHLGLDHTRATVVRNQIMTDAFCQTQEPGLYAIGDVTGGPWLAHKASHEGILCVEHMAGRPVHPLKKDLIPGCIYSSPQLASVGLTERQAQEQGLCVNVGRFPFAANGQALALAEPEGLVKVIFDQTTGELLGAHLVGASVTELIQGFVIAKSLEATQESLAHIVFAHPTLSEALHEAILDAKGQALHI